MISEASLRDRVKNIAKTVHPDKSVNGILKQLYLERFLARLARSQYADKFIFKGGNLLAYFIELGRETKDLDFLITRLSAEESTLVSVFKEISAISPNDGFAMTFIGIDQLAQPHMNYPGFRATLEVKFIAGTLKDTVQIDVGVGDEVTPERQAIELLKYKEEPFFERSLSLMIYPLETVFAEKLETVVAKAEINSRMKDFHDLLLMSRKEGLMDSDRLEQDIKATFAHRGTDTRLPLKFSDQNYERMNGHWRHHLRGLGNHARNLGLPQRIEQVVMEVNGFLGRAGLLK